MNSQIFGEDNDEPPPPPRQSEASTPSVLTNLSLPAKSNKHQTIHHRNNILFDKFTQKPRKKLIYPAGSSNFLISPVVNKFRRRYFPLSTGQQWNDWRWQLRNRISDLASLEKILQLSESER
jgi:hypothetical protein